VTPAPAAAAPASRTGAVRRGSRALAVSAPVANREKPRGAGGPPARRVGADPATAPAGGKAAGLLTRAVPYVTVVIAAFAPLAAAIYLLTTVAWTLAERRLFLRRAARDA
jgi:YidC/Oxa1 family membrane protein insertase